MPSKTHSCSELEEGAKLVMEVKKEAETEQELTEKIKDGVRLLFTMLPL